MGDFTAMGDIIASYIVCLSAIESVGLLYIHMIHYITYMHTYYMHKMSHILLDNLQLAHCGPGG